MFMEDVYGYHSPSRGIVTKPRYANLTFDFAELSNGT